MAEVEEVPANVAEEREEQKTLQEDAEGKREGSPSSASSSDPEGVDAGEEKEQGGETQATGEEQTEPQEPVEGMQILPIVDFTVHGVHNHTALVHLRIVHRADSVTLVKRKKMAF